LVNAKKELSAAIEEVNAATAEKTEGEMAPTIFRGLLSIANLSESETAPRPGDETRILLSAGSDTTANTSAAITYRLLAAPESLKRLKEELETAY
jgi:cytochrome P450